MILSDEYIRFETAKLAKEVGSDIETEHAFRLRYGEVKEYFSGFQNWNHWEEDEIEEFFSRPLQSTLQKWLREKHKINVFCLPDNYESDVWFSVIGGYGDPKVKNDGGRRTYEEALEVGLYEALKLIKNED